MRDAQARAVYEQRRQERACGIAVGLEAVRERMLLPAPDAAPAQLAAFKLLYESRDGRLCLFEGECGSLTAVDSSRLA